MVLSRYYTFSQSENVRNQPLSGPPPPSQSEIVKIQSFQDTTPSLTKSKLSKISSYMTITSSQSENYPKSVLSRAPYPPQSGNCQKSSPFKPSFSKRGKTDQNQSFQEHHILQKWKLLKMSPFKTTTLLKVEIVKK